MEREEKGFKNKTEYMNFEQMQQGNTKSTLRGLAVFIIFMAASIGIFFFFVQKDVEKNAKEIVRENVARQSYHFNSIMETQFEYLEVIADYMGEQEELLCEANLALMESLFEKSGLERVAIIDTEGNSRYDNGQVKSVASRPYFQESMKGNRALSDPLESMVDGDTRVILSVPIYQGGDIVGVLGGSYNVGALSHILFEDIYDGVGYSLIVTADGTLVSYDGDEKSSRIWEGNNFFDYYKEFEFEGRGSLEKVERDFGRHNGGYVVISRGENSRYLTYEPLELNEWMLCYVVPVKKVHEDYDFIREYETVLAVVVLAGILLLLLFIWYHNNAKQSSLIQYAQTDPLTDVLNKKRTEESIEQWLKDERCERMQAFFMIDVDNFKTINDAYGHAAGDEALQKVAGLLREVFWRSDIVGRIGGDEFVVLMKNVGEKEAAVTMAESVCAGMHKLQVKGIDSGMLSCSIGVAYAPEHGSSYQELYKGADVALYQTKRKGRIGYTEYKG